MDNNLSELNDILFDTLRGIKDGKIPAEQAHAIIGVSNNIINNAKTQLQAYKLTNGKVGVQTFIGLPGPSEAILQSKDRFLQMNEFALLKGHHSITDAMSKMGKAKFEQEFSNWIKRAS